MEHEKEIMKLILDNVGSDEEIFKKLSIDTLDGQSDVRVLLNEWNYEEYITLLKTSTGTRITIKDEGRIFFTKNS